MLAELTALLSLVPEESWWAGLAAAIFGVVAANWNPLRQRFHHWRLGRRLARTDGMLAEEEREYQLAIGGDLEPLDIPRSVLSALGAAALLITFFTLDDLGYGGSAQAALLGFGALSWIYSYWRKINDPPPDPAEQEEAVPPDFVVPNEAWAGVGFAALIAALLAAYIFTLGSAG